MELLARAEAIEARLRSVSVPPGAAVVGRALGEMSLDALVVSVSAVTVNTSA